MTRLMLEGQFDHELGLYLQKGGLWYWLGWHIHMLGKIIQAVSWAGLVLCLGAFV